MILAGVPGKHTLRFWLPALTAAHAPAVTLRTRDGARVVTEPPLEPRLLAEGSEFVGYRVAATGLKPDTAYRLEAKFPGIAPLVFSAFVHTLPDVITSTFVTAIGSCYSLSEDRGAIRHAYPPAVFRDRVNPVRLRFLAGDQLYLDLDRQSGNPLIAAQPNPWDVYRAHWQNPAYASFLAATPTGYLADDHEYWNDYPHRSVWLTWTGGGPGRRIGRAADRAFDLYQAALNPAPGEEGCLPDNVGVVNGFARSFRIDVAPLSFFALDCRTGRSKYDAEDHPHFVTRIGSGQPEFTALEAWARDLTGPGVLVLPQPLVEQPASAVARAMHTMGDVNLPDYADDYKRLWDVVFQKTKHSILILTGDIHVSRLLEIWPLRYPGAHRKSVWELAASPLVHIKHGSGTRPRASKRIDVTGAAGEVQTVHAQVDRLGTANRRTYGTVEFRPGPHHVSVDLRLWNARANGAELIQDFQIKLF